MMKHIQRNRIKKWEENIHEIREKMDIQVE